MEEKTQCAMLKQENTVGEARVSLPLTRNEFEKVTLPLFIEIFQKLVLFCSLHKP